MQWFKVILAGLIEIVWVTGLNTADSLLSWTGTFIVIIISFFLVISACKYLPVGTVYAVFVGIGAVGTVLVDMIFFGDPFDLVKNQLNYHINYWHHRVEINYRGG